MKELSNKELLEVYKILKDFIDSLKQKLEESKNDRES